MRISILLFGIAKDIIGSKNLEIEVNEECRVNDLKQEILNQYPGFENLKHLAIAVNNEYARGETSIKPSDEIALIPPVSGG